MVSVDEIWIDQQVDVGNLLHFMELKSGVKERCLIDSHDSVWLTLEKPKLWRHNGRMQIQVQM